MKKFFSELGYRMQNFMRGRHGTDELSIFLNWTAIVLWLLSLITGLSVLYPIGVVLFIWSLFRSMSRNLYKRETEREAFLRLRRKLSGPFRVRFRMLRERKTHKYFKCPNCRSYVRISKPPKGISISVRCSKCGTEFTKRT